MRTFPRFARWAAHAAGHSGAFGTQTRDTIALQLKIDELIRVFEGAHTVLLDLEELTEDELEEIRKRYTELARKAREELRRGHRDTGRPRL